MGNITGAVGGGALGALIGGPVGLVVGGFVGGATGTVAEVVNGGIGDKVHRGRIYNLYTLDDISNYTLERVTIRRCNLYWKSTNTVGAFARVILAPGTTISGGSFWFEHWWIIIEVKGKEWVKENKEKKLKTVTKYITGYKNPNGIHICVSNTWGAADNDSVTGVSDCSGGGDKGTVTGFTTAYGSVKSLKTKISKMDPDYTLSTYNCKDFASKLNKWCKIKC